MQKPADGGRKADVHLGNAKFGIPIGPLVRKVNVVHADDFAPVGIDDLLVEQVFLHGKPCFVRVVELKGRLVRGQLDAARRDEFDLVVARHKRAVPAAAHQQARDAVGLLVRNDEHFLDAADEIA